jgi:hypothetical protein
MQFRHLLFTVLTISLITGCSSRSKGFFEDIYSATEVRSATSRDYSDIKGAANAPIIKDEPKEYKVQQNRSYTSTSSEVYSATGKIIDADYDKDVNLYVYAFLKSGTSNPISFYYDKDLNPIGGVVTITVKDNFLTSISNSNLQKTQRTGTKRKRSRIKIPTIEKINTL